MRNAGLDEAQAGINISRRNINNLRYADDTTLMAESEAELKSFLMWVKKESEKTGLKLNVQKAKIIASSPITSWEIDGETVETVADFIFLAPMQMVTATMKLKDTYSLKEKLCPTCCYVASVVSDSVRPHGRQPSRLLCSWDSPGKNTGVGCHCLLQVHLVVCTYLWFLHVFFLA